MYIAGAARTGMSGPDSRWWAAGLVAAVVLLAVPMTAAAGGATAAQEEEPTEFTATSGSGELRIGGDDGQTIGIGSGDIVIEGEAYEDGTWESTDVEFGNVDAGVSADVTAPNGLSGEYDPESDTFTVEGELVISALGEEFRFDLAAESEDGETDLDEDGGRAVVADETFTVGATGNEAIDGLLGLPATEPGENSMRVPFDIETASEPPELTATPDSVQFEDITVGETTTETVTVANTGGEPFELQRAELRQWPGEPRLGAELPLELAPGEQREVAVTFAPERTGVRTTTLVLVGGQPSLRELVPVASGDVETEVTVEDGQTRIDASVREARANESVNIAVPDDTETDDEFEMEGFEITPAEDVDIGMEIETSNRSLETTPETDAGLTPNAAQLGNISIETNLEPEQSERVEITTRINKSRLDALDTDPGNVTLYRFDESEDRWRAQDTEVIEETPETVRIQGIADHASEWTAAAARPEFEITRSDVDVEVATVEETVTIDVFVENTGGTEGTYVADLLLNEEVVDSKESVIAEGGEALFDFERAFDQPGTYEVQVNEQQITQIEVTEDETVEAETGSDGSEPDNSTDGEDETTSSDGTGPGFGVLVGLLAVVSAAIVKHRHP